MAATVQSQHSLEVSAARTFWQDKMQEHPTIAGLLAILGEVAGFFLNGHFIVALARWIIRVSGYIAESALLFAVLWISATSVAPGLIELFMSEKTMQSLVWLALIVLALIPEIILGNAIISVAGHWQAVASDRHNVMAWVWAIAFTLPTVLFLILTALTLNALASDGGTFVQASNGLVGMRCFAGWTYGLLALVYAGIGRKTLNQAQAIVTPAAQPVPVPVQTLDYAEIAHQLLPTLRNELKQANGDVTQELHKEMQAHMAQLSEQIVNLVAVQIPAKSEPVEEPVQEKIVNLQSYREVHDDETADEPETRPTPRITVNLQAAKSETKREPAKASGTAQEKAARILKRTPKITASELAKRAGCTPQYAGRLIKKQSVN
jgi:hypothetical protein